MAHFRRALVQLALLPVLYVASLPNPAVFGLVVGILLLIPPFVTAAVAGVLVWTSRQAPEIATLRERADDALTAFLQALGAGAVGAVVLLQAAGILIPGRPALALLAWVCLLIGVPSIRWARTWRDYWLPAMRRQHEEQAPVE